MRRFYYAVGLVAAVCVLPCGADTQEANATRQEKVDKAMEGLYQRLGCSSCHGIYGNGMGANPRLSGRTPEYLYERLIQLKAGKTRTSGGAVMVSFARSLSEAQARKMAVWLATLRPKENEEIYDEEYDPNDDGGS